MPNKLLTSTSRDVGMHLMYAEVRMQNGIRKKKQTVLQRLSEEAESQVSTLTTLIF